MLKAAIITTVSACGLAVPYVLGRLRAARKVPEPTKSCAWARALYFNGLISIDELHRFVLHHGKCPTCLLTDEENANSQVR